MYIFLDEAGSFILPKTKPWSICVVGGLIVPKSTIKRLFKDFEILKKVWGYEGEIKGSKLSEEEVNSFISMLSKYNVFFEAVAIDMGDQTEKNIAKHKKAQVKKTGSNIKSDATEFAKQFTSTTRAKMYTLSNQLYVQMQLTISLIENILQKSTMYYAKSEPRALKDFHWFVDAKSKDKVTPVEELWRDIIMPMSQQRSLSQPVIILNDKEYDYSFFFQNRETNEIPRYMKQRVGDLKPEDTYDPKSIFYKKIKFKESHKCLGIQMIDILATTLRRAMNNNLQMRGWQNLGRVMLRLGGMQTINMLTFSKSNIQNEHKYYFDIIDIMNVTACDVLEH